MKHLFATFAIIVLTVVCLSAPLEQEQYRWQDDPELTAGYFQGDMILNQSLERTGLRSETKRWPDGIVYYKFGDVFDYDHRRYIEGSMRIIEAVSCIRFKQADAGQKYFINITNKADGCYSSVGFDNKVQISNFQIFPLDQGCFRLGTIIHEFLHTLGFYHMQSASNRDDYVRIAVENIKDGRLDEFIKYNSKLVTDFGVEYEYGSIMHYPANAFSKNQKRTIVPLKEEWNDIMGQRLGMTQSDVIKLNHMYACPKKV